jgi:hypothetical protein
MKEAKTVISTQVFPGLVFELVSQVFIDTPGKHGDIFDVTVTIN